jgi:hypothetical protein
MMQVITAVGFCRYKGWRVTYSANAPVTGRWKATKYGISMCHTTEEGLKRMIDVNLHDKWYATAHLPQ